MLFRTKEGFIEININDFITDEAYYEKIMSLKEKLLNFMK